MGNCLSDPEPGAGMHEATAGHKVQGRDFSDEAVQQLFGGAECTSRVELRISCKGLKGKDGLLGKSDPFAVVYEKVDNNWVERGRTEVVSNNHDPEFVQGIPVNYNFEMVQEMRVDIYDADEVQSNVNALALNKQDNLGSFLFKMPSVVSGTVEGPLSSGKSGKVRLMAEEIVDFKKELQLEIRGHKLANKDGWGGKSDPFLRVCRPKPSGKGGFVYVPVFQTAVRMDNLNPVWGDLTLHLGRVCGGDLNAKVLFQILDWDADGRHDMIGKVKASINDIVRMSETGDQLDLEHPKKKKVTGKISFVRALIQESPSFLDYLHMGLKLDMFVAVDFTMSNRPPKEPRSLHYRGDGATPYERAIMGVGSILDFYNPTKTYQAWAFGAAVSGGGTSHCYPLNGNPSDPTVVGTEGIVHAYHGLLDNSNLSGPTFFEPVIREVTDKVKQYSRGSQYGCLLILTDGAITDLDKTISSIVEASREAMSIIIVGIGNADFSSMNYLDGDDGVLKNKAGQAVARDIVQFVSFNQHAGNGMKLAEAVLAELPGQVVQYMKAHSIFPPNIKPPAQAAPATTTPYV